MTEPNTTFNTNSAQICASRQHILEIADIYINRYTCAQMCDRLADCKRYSAEANNWLLAQCNANGITKDDLRSAFAELKNTTYANNACCWDLSVL